MVTLSRLLFVGHRSCGTSLWPQFGRWGVSRYYFFEVGKKFLLLTGSGITKNASKTDEILDAMHFFLLSVGQKGVVNIFGDVFGRVKLQLHTYCKCYIEKCWKV